MALEKTGYGFRSLSVPAQASGIFELPAGSPGTLLKRKARQLMGLSARSLRQRLKTPSNKIWRRPAEFRLGGVAGMTAVKIYSFTAA